MNTAPERVPRSDVAHEYAAEQTPAALAHAEEERAHDAHDAGDGGRPGDLGHVGHGRGHHEGHGEALQRLVRVDVDGVLEEGVAEEADEVGNLNPNS